MSSVHLIGGNAYSLVDESPMYRLLVLQHQRVVPGDRWGIEYNTFLSFPPFTLLSPFRSEFSTTNNLPETQQHYILRHTYEKGIPGYWV